MSVSPTPVPAACVDPDGKRAGHRIVAVGELLWDLLPAGAVLGGAPFNFAFRMAGLGDDVAFVSRVGRDALGDRARGQVAACGLATKFLQADDTRPTGTVPVVLDAQGTPHFTIVPGVAYDAIEVTPENVEAAREADCVYYGTLVQREAGSREALAVILGSASFAVKVLDVNLRAGCYSAETVGWSLERADILKINESEVGELGRLLGWGTLPVTGFVARCFRTWRLGYMAVTLGAQGAYAASSSGEKVYVPGRVVEVRDTCGCGDAFTAGFVHALLGQLPLAECCRLGNAMGALVATQSGGTAPLSKAEIMAFMRTEGPVIRAAEFAPFEVPTGPA